MIVGGIANLRGLCPVCGTDVDRTHEWNPSTVGDTYTCPDCGETEYTSLVRGSLASLSAEAV